MAPLTHVRSTLLTTSLDLLSKRGYRELYLAQLAPADRDAILGASVGTWLPVALAEVHYRACDGLGLSGTMIAEIGAASGDATGRLFLPVALSLARGSGMTPWFPLQSAQRFWERYYRGSGVSVYKLGPKEAEFEVAGSPLARFAYWRGAFRSILLTFVLRFAQSGHVNERPARNDAGAALYRLSWV